MSSIPPQAINAEKKLVATLLNKPDLIDQVRDLPPEAFITPQYQVTLAAMKALDLEGQPITIDGILAKINGSPGSPTEFDLGNWQDAEYGKIHEDLTDIIQQIRKADLKRKQLITVANIQASLNNGNEGESKEHIEHLLLIQGQIEAGKRDARSRITSITDADLRQKEFAPLDFLVDDFLLTEGIHLLVGRQKTGKSLMGMQIGVAVAAGTEALGGLKTKKGPVLYLALEDCERRLKDRLLNLSESGLPDLHIVTSIDPRLLTSPQEFLVHLDRKVEELDGCRLLILDPWMRIQAFVKAANKGNAFSQEYALMSLFRDFVSRRKIALLIMHHERKMAAGQDPYDIVSGSLGLQAASDVIMLLTRLRGETQGHLKRTGNDVPEKEIGLDFDQDKYEWSVSDEPANIFALGATKKVIVRHFIQARKYLQAKEVAEALAMPISTVRNHLSDLFEEGHLECTRRGKNSFYRYPDSESASQVALLR